MEHFNSEVTLDVEVEILEAVRARPGHPHDRPERSVPAEPAQVVLAVWLHGDDPLRRIDLVPWLPPEVHEALVAEALERLEDR